MADWDVEGRPNPECRPKKRQSCPHKFVHLKEVRKCDYGGYNSKFTLVNYFFCEHCLEQKEIKKEEYSRETPAWFY